VSSPAPETFALISGGGTGGHVFPALALADELVARGHARSSIHFVGARRGIEATAVPAAGYTIELLPGRGMLRAWTPRAAQNAAADTGPRGARRRWCAERHRAVVGGAYAPARWCGRDAVIPTVVHRPDPGLATGSRARCARGVFPPGRHREPWSPPHPALRSPPSGASVAPAMVAVGGASAQVKSTTTVSAPAVAWTGNDVVKTTSPAHATTKTPTLAGGWRHPVTGPTTLEAVRGAHGHAALGM
jgi:hypothetical protein